MQFKFQVGRDPAGEVCSIRVEYTFDGNSVPGLVRDLRIIADEIEQANEAEVKRVVEFAAMPIEGRA